MVACSIARWEDSDAPHTRISPPALEEASITEGQDDAEFLAWTFTPNFLRSTKDGHSRCFVKTAQPAQLENRQHSVYLVRELEIEPTTFKKKSVCPRTRQNKPPLEIRVREEDFRKCGDNWRQLLPQKPSTPPTYALSKNIRRRCPTAQRSASISALGCSGEKELQLPVLDLARIDDKRAPNRKRCVTPPWDCKNGGFKGDADMYKTAPPLRSSSSLPNFLDEKARSWSCGWNERRQ